MGTQAQGGKKVWIADQDQSESRLLGQVESQEHPDIFQGAHGVVLGFIEQQHRDDAAQFAKGLSDSAMRLSPRIRPVILWDSIATRLRKSPYSNR